MWIDFSLLLNSLPMLFVGAVKTVQIAILAIFCGMLGGMLIGTLNCRQFRCLWIGVALNAFVWSVRGTPLFVQVLIVYYALPEVIGVSLSPFAAGVLALAINSSAYISEIVRGGLDAIPRGQWDAAYVLGLSPWYTFKGIAMPQMFRIAIPSFTNELTALIKETSILMAIGVTELTKVTKDVVARELDPMTMYLGAAVIYLLMTSTISTIAKVAERKFHL